MSKVLNKVKRGGSIERDLADASNLSRVRYVEHGECAALILLKIQDSLIIRSGIQEHGLTVVLSYFGQVGRKLYNDVLRFHAGTTGHNERQGKRGDSKELDRGAIHFHPFQAEWILNHQMIHLGDSI